MRTIKRIALTLVLMSVYAVVIGVAHWVAGESRPDPAMLLGALVGYIGCDIFTATKSKIQ